MLFGILKKHLFITISSLFVGLFVFYVSYSYYQLKDDAVDSHTYILGSYVGNMDYVDFSQTIGGEKLSTIIVDFEDEQNILTIDTLVQNKIRENLWKNIMDFQSRQSQFSRLMRQVFRQDLSITIKDMDKFTYESFSHEDLESLYVDFDIPQVQEGEVSFNGSKIITEYAAAGERFILPNFEKGIVISLFSDDQAPVVITLQAEEPKYQKQDIDELAGDLELILNTERTLQYVKDPELFVKLDSEFIKQLVIASYNFNTERFVFGFNEEQLSEITNQFLPKYALQYIDDKYNVQVQPEQSGIIITEDQLREVFHNTFSSYSEIIEISSGVYTEASLTTDDVAVSGINHVVSEFTTYHGCCGTRVENIQLIADMLDGHMLQPGEVLNVNEIIGERTLEKGFKPAGSILKGQLTDSVGGGISQFITTLHNAVYWGGYEIITHKPHSIYFSRYPKGVEATINWPYVDYIFRNDTEYPLMIDTEYTDTSITVRILGNNYDRIFIGDHRGNTNKNIVRTSEKARKVISIVSDPYNYRDPLVVYENNNAVLRGKPQIHQTGKKGWSVMVERKVLQEGKVIHHDKKPVHYFSDKETIIYVHPCDNPSEYIPSCYGQ